MILKDVEFNVRGEIPEIEDIIRCVTNLIMTPAGTVPLDRDFGIDQSFLGLPIDVAQNIFAVEIIDKAEKYEPRINITEVELIPLIDGIIKAKVVIESA